MIEKQGLIYKTWGKRTLLLRENGNDRLQTDYPTANFRDTKCALVGITRKYESPEAMIDRINGMKTHFLREAESAFALHNQARNELYKQQKAVRNGSKSE